MRIAPITILCVLAGMPAAAGSASARGVLPNLDMEAPYDLQKTTDGAGHTFVAFGASIGNAGPGVLKVVGQRVPGSDLMDATQVVLSTGSVQTGVAVKTIPKVGKLQFSPSPDHFHWHFLHFEDYQLLSVPNLDFVAPTRKTGFCLSGLNSDFYCGGGKPELQTIGDPATDTSTTTPNPATEAMGMIAKGSADNGLPSRSYADDYGPTIEGQDIEITNVPKGRYCLSFVVNPNRKLAETNFDDNGGSALIDVGGVPGGERSLKQPKDTPAAPTAFRASPSCGLTKPSGRPKAFTPDSAAKLSTAALRKALGKPRSVTSACRAKGSIRASCRVDFTQAGAPYKGTVAITQKRFASEWRWFYNVDVKRTRRTSCAKKAGDLCPAQVKTGTMLGGIAAVDRGAARAALKIPTGTVAVPSKPGVAWKSSYLCKLNTPGAGY